MKVRASVRKICKDCVISIRNRTVLVNCKKNKRHKQRQG